MYIDPRFRPEYAVFELVTRVFQPSYNEVFDGDDKMFIDVVHLTDEVHLKDGLHLIDITK